MTRKFGTLTAVDRLTFRVERGEIFGLLGPNGAGKTTTVRMLSCLIGKTSGQAWVGDHEIGRADDAMQIRKMVGLVPDNVGLYEDMSAYRNLDFYGKLYEIPDSARPAAIERFLRLLGLWEKRDLLVGTFSKGMKQKVAIARALIHDPPVLFLDEPTANLDPESAKTVRDFILELKAQGKTICLNTHNLDEAHRICDRIGILDTSLVAVGTPAQLEESVWGRRTVFQLEAVTDSIVRAVESTSGRSVTRQGSQLTVEAKDPEAENPRIVEAIVRAGGRVQYVSRLNPSLEDAYLKLVKKGP